MHNFLTGRVRVKAAELNNEEAVARRFCKWPFYVKVAINRHPIASIHSPRAY
jgi:hypothetical protein